MKKLISWISGHFLGLFTLLLLAFALFFTLSVETRRRTLAADSTVSIESGDIVEVVKAIDGDEIQIREVHGGTTVLRLLGIKSFSSTINDPLISQYGKVSYDYLRAQLEGKQVKVKFGEPKLDVRKRLLAYVYLDTQEEAYGLDVGRDMISKGYTLVYTRYDFGKMDEYLKAAAAAEAAKRGLWASDILRNRAKLLDAAWREEKIND